MAFQALSLRSLSANGAITALDVMRLESALTFESPMDEDDALGLIAIELSGSLKHPNWKGFFIDAIAEYTLGQSEPVGYLTAAKADWLLSKVAPRGRILTPYMYAMLDALLSTARWVPERLVAAMFDELYCAVAAADGPLRQSTAAPPQTITTQDSNIARHILYCAGSGAPSAISRTEAAGLLAITAAATVASPEWTELIAKVLANAVLTASGYSGPVREIYLAPEHALSSTAPLSDRIAQDLKQRYRLQTTEDRAITALERQRIAIVTGDEPQPASATWLAGALAQHHQPPSEGLAVLKAALAASGLPLAAPLAEVLGLPSSASTAIRAA